MTTSLEAISRRVSPCRVRLVAAIAVALGIAAALARPVDAAGNFLWRASRGQAVVYLAGSLHLLSQDHYPLSQPFESAFKESDLLVEEVDLAEMSQAGQLGLLMRGMFTDGRSLDQVLSPETRALVASHAATQGLPLESFQVFKPWMLALTLLGIEWQKSGFDPNLGLDKHFYDRAVAEKKAVQGLETVEFQISRFDQLTMDEQDRMLRSTLKEIETQRGSVSVLAAAWKAGDVETVERIVLQDLRTEPRVYESLLVSRNRDWLPKIERLFDRPGRTLVVVGAAHLVGPDGLLALLRSKGYAIEQL
jgi:uncharacterized protein YbaP (TraB family)